MKLSHLIANVEGVSVLSGSDPTVLSVTDDSRKVGAGTLFIARSGSRECGERFITQAIVNGAVAICVDGSASTEAWSHTDVAIVTTTNAPQAATALAHAFHRFPARSMRMIGITGTNGKTTTAFLVQHLMRQGGDRCGLLGTVLTDDGKRSTPSELTTPGATELASILGSMAANNCRAAVMEVSSHALHQGRVDGIDFAVGVFTNLTGDHLDYHKSMEEYGAAKALLFRRMAVGSCAVVNMDDPAHVEMVRDCEASVLRCSVQSRRAECFAHVVGQSLGWTRMHMHGPWGEFEVEVPCVGLHNAMNALQAAAVAWSLGVGRDALHAGLSTAPSPPGRLEPVTAATSPFAVLVDYAHTDDALLNVLTALRPVVGDGKILLVFGCGGDRDKSKRPRMAATAVAYADHIIVTSDNPRTESPQAIIDDICAGIPAHCAVPVERECDRSMAIRRAIALARRGDVVLIAGKGHEDYQIIGTEKFPFDDRVVARAALASGSPCASQVRGVPLNEPEGVAS
ncbi:MAG: UDP-N-acetylmuramoyl-L-alanyl-D-glutamate--2,6-diaminopimelate ligase [Phycisphaerales bacterium]|nr:UDP-N-acetylmuramoyl-L-alanyl-D-glutamate--2,6-diaminopimelate ligase [Phycisphaerales bacterium]